MARNCHRPRGVAVEHSSRWLIGNWRAGGEGLHQAACSTRGASRLVCLDAHRGGRDAPRAGPQPPVREFPINHLVLAGEAAGAVEAVDPAERFDPDARACVGRVDELATADVDADMAEAVE